MNHADMKVVYIAGPFRAPTRWLVEDNIRRAEELALEVWKLGHPAVCVHTMVRFYEGEAEDEMWLEGDLAILAKCDAVIFTEGWRTSPGVVGEYEFARTHEIPRFFELEALAEWLDR